MDYSTPDITPAQGLAALAAIGAQLVDAQLIDGRPDKLIVGIAGIVLPLAWVAADAIIRHGRSRALAPAPLPPSSGA
jgi:hypothetical protein